jgi:N-methylhydantoinase A
VFSALGLLSADFVMRYDQTVAWDLGSGRLNEMNAVADSMVATARAAMGDEGFADDDIAVARSGDFRFLGQSYELTMSLPDRALTADDAPGMAESFLELYEQTYGEGTAWKGVPVQLLNYTVTVTGRRDHRLIPTIESDPRSEPELRVSTRHIFLPSTREYQEVPIYDDARFTAGTRIAGPAIIDAVDTTIFVPPGSDATRDEFMNYVLTIPGGPH